MPPPPNPARVPVFLVLEGLDDKGATYTVVEASGFKLDGGTWSIRKGCMINVVQAEKVYLSRGAAEARIEELRKR